MIMIKERSPFCTEEAFGLLMLKTERSLNEKAIKSLLCFGKYPHMIWKRYRQ